MGDDFFFEVVNLIFKNNYVDIIHPIRRATVSDITDYRSSKEIVIKVKDFENFK
jgi:hypothetical protein